MWQFISGTLLGIFGTYFKLHKDERSKIYFEKFEVYKSLNSLTLDTLHSVLSAPSGATENINHEKYRSVCFDYFLKNSLLLSKEPIESIYKFMTISFADAKANEDNYYSTYFDIINSFRSDLMIEPIHNMSKFVATAPNIFKTTM